MYNELVAKVEFTDVDGSKVQFDYARTGEDIYDLLDYLGYYLSDEGNFHKTKNPVALGLNGIIDTSKPISILINRASSK